MVNKKIVRILALAALLPASGMAAKINVINGDPPGVGFNDPTPAVPVGGNPGTTVGQQALNVFTQAANLWGGRLQSKQEINIIAFFMPLPCTATGGVLGAAGANWYFANSPGAKGGKALEPDTWHHSALAEKITNRDLSAEADPSDPFDIFALFNSDLGKPGCLTGNGWYYGLDNNQPSNRIDLLAVVLHEFGHGLGFSVGPTNSSTGVRAAGLPSVWERQMYDVTAGKTWRQMTNAERAASARNDGNLVWIGQKASNVVPSVLDRALFLVTLSPAGIPTESPSPASFGPQPTQAPGQRTMGYVSAPSDGGGVSLLDGCEPFPSSADTAGRIVLVNRGTCAFTVKAINAQNAGAAAVLIANNAAGPLAPGGTDPNVTIPVFGITQALGDALRAAAAAGTPYVEIGVEANVRAGTTAGFPRLYAPNPFVSGSSVSHWDVTASPSLLMEPSITPALGSSVKNPEDLSRGLLFDIGW